MSVSNTPHALTAIQAVETTSAILSFFGSSITIYKIISQSKQNVITNKMLVILLVIDFVLSIVYGVGIAGGNDHGFCQFQVAYRLKFYFYYLLIFFLLLGSNCSMVWTCSCSMGLCYVISYVSMDRS